jgi:hypothetical protein
MKRSRIKTGSRSIERGSTFKAEAKQLERTRLDRGKPRRRSTVEQAQAREWHRMISAGRLCVRRDCTNRAGPFGHHLVEKSWLRRHGLAGHAWDLQVGCPICEGCHANHTAAADGKTVTRDDLIAAGIWARVVAWARRLDAEYFPGRELVLATLEHDYPEMARAAA